MRAFDDSQKLRERISGALSMETALSSIGDADKIVFGDIRLMASKKKSSIERSGECYRPSWKRSFLWVFLWTLVFSPFWIIASHGAFCGMEPMMRKNGMTNHNEFLFGAGQILAMASVPLGLLTSELLSRRGCGSWVLGLGGIAVWFLSLLGGISVAISAFYVVAQ